MSYVDKVAVFIEAFKPTVDFGKLIREEFNEWFTELEERPGTEFELKELADLMYVVQGYAVAHEWEIDQLDEDVKTVLDKIKEFNNKYPDFNIASSIVTTGYAEFITSRDYLWLYRLATGIVAYAIHKNLPLAEGFDRVHTSNMSKLGDDGNPVYREDGKVMKGPNYQPPQLADLFVSKEAAIQQAEEKRKRKATKKMANIVGS